MPAVDSPEDPRFTGECAVAEGTRRPDLSVVMPVYNEAEALPSVLAEWLEEFDRLDLVVDLVAYDDGSTDDSGRIVEAWARDNPGIRVVRQTNRGHGPTILRGYRRARADWVFQVDSDGELGPEAFESLWEEREGYDLLVGYRDGRRSSAARRVVTLFSRWVVAVLFGRAMRDVNSPYRLMRRSALQRMLGFVPADSFAPNVLLSGVARRLGLRVLELPVAHQARRGGAVSLTSWRLLGGAFATFRQALATRSRLRGVTS